MLSHKDILQTRDMIDKRHLDIRTITMGISLLDCALYSKFESVEALRNYAHHPLHLEAKEHFFHLLDSRVAADYEV